MKSFLFLSVLLLNFAFLQKNEALADMIDDHKKFECQDPEPSELQQKLLKYEFVMMEKKFIDYGLSFDDYNYYQIHDRSKRTSAYESLCPTEQYIENSANFFPFTIVIKECKCKKCAFLPEENFNCAPWLEERYFLEKGKCLKSGFYEWNPFAKNITVGCGCKSLN